MSEERERIRKRVEEFRALQEKLARDREDRMNRETENTRALLREMRQKFKTPEQ